jgi:AcrR family transcriptional regulator
MTPEETRIRIVQSAAQAFADRGFRASSIKTIARIACVNEVTVYRHFPKKRELYWNAIEWKLSTALGAASLIMEMHPNATPKETLRRIAIRILESFDHDPDLARLLYFTALELDSERGRAYEGHLKPLLALLQEQVRAWTIRGWMREVDPESAALSITGILISHCNLYKILGARPSVHRTNDQIATEYADICLDGLGVVLPS